MTPSPQSNHLPFRYLAPDEIVARREKGLYFNCDAQFVKGHRCAPAKLLCMIIDNPFLSTYEDG